MAERIPPGRSTLVVIDGNRDGSLELSRRFYDDVLRPLFPPAELIDPWWVGATYEYDGPFLLALEGDDVVGGALGEWYPKSQALLLGYLAVHPDRRGAGIGSLIMAAVSERWYPAYPLRLALAEIDVPSDEESSMQDPWLRLRFYASLGAEALAVPYFQPALGPGAQRVPRMLLAVLAASPDALVRPGVVCGAAVRAFLDEYVEACEGTTPDPENDAELRALLEACSGEVALIALVEAASGR